MTSRRDELPYSVVLEVPKRVSRISSLETTGEQKLEQLMEDGLQSAIEKYPAVRNLLLRNQHKDAKDQDGLVGFGPSLSLVETQVTKPCKEPFGDELTFFFKHVMSPAARSRLRLCPGRGARSARFLSVGLGIRLQVVTDLAGRKNIARPWRPQRDRRRRTPEERAAYFMRKWGVRMGTVG
jgi:hypothetical protein